MASMSGHNPPEHIPAVWWPHDTALRPPPASFIISFFRTEKLADSYSPRCDQEKSNLYNLYKYHPCISYLRLDMCGTQLWPGVRCKCLSPGCMNARRGAADWRWDIARTRWGEVQVPGSKFLWYVSRDPGRDVWCSRENNIIIFVYISTQCSVLKWNETILSQGQCL